MGILCLASFAVAQDTAWEKYVNVGNEAFRLGQYADFLYQFRAALREAEEFGPDARSSRGQPSRETRSLLPCPGEGYAKSVPL